ncbi:hypothetical protein JW962_01300 [Candidatus Dojkabacteria bacterium]|nr:hypothetical protein [Candidatus Dojkabacteria bacterium]
MDNIKSVFKQYNNSVKPDDSTVMRIWNRISSNLDQMSQREPKVNPKQLIKSKSWARFVLGFAKNLLIGGAFVPLSLVIGFLTFNTFEVISRHVLPGGNLGLNQLESSENLYEEAFSTEEKRLKESSDIGELNAIDFASPPTSIVDDEHISAKETNTREILDKTETHNAKDGYVRAIIYFGTGLMVITIGWGLYGVIRLIRSRID